MASINLNIRMDKEVKEQAEQIFQDLGMNMSTAVNLFLRTVIRENGIPFALKLDVPNAATQAAFAEGERLLKDPQAEGYNDLNELKKALLE